MPSPPNFATRYVLLPGNGHRRLAGHFHTLLEGITRNPDAAIGTVELLSEAERQHLLVELNQTAMSYPHDQCLHHLIEQQAMRTPDRPAVMCGERCLTCRTQRPCQSTGPSLAQGGGGGAGEISGDLR